MKWSLRLLAFCGFFVGALALGQSFQNSATNLLCGLTGLYCVVVNPDGSINVDATISGSVVVSPVPTQSIAGTVTANQGAPGPTSSPWPVTLVSPSPVPVVFASPSPTISVSVLNFPATQTVTQGTASNLNATVVTTGGATIAKDSSLTTINTTLGSPMQNSGGSVTANAGTNLNTSALDLEATQSAFKSANHTDLTTLNTTLGSPMQNSGGSVTANAGTNLNTSALSTSANQTNGTQQTQVTDNVNGVAAIKAASTAAVAADKALVVAISPNNTLPTKAPVNANATLSARQTVTTTESTVSAPSNSVGVLVECESGNADNLRWGFSNSAGAILSSTLGVLCEPGRDSGFLPLGTGTVLHLISTGAGSDFADVIWVLSQ